ncbi:MAG: hypothetical protein HQ559_01650 [Lentisphaerae bacterium]|nr:hypothetical protein [Lentisphaerota bacterium]
MKVIEIIVLAAALFLLGIVLAIGFSLLLAFPVMWLWNWLMPVIFGLPLVSYWQAWGLSMFSALLVRSGASSICKATTK